MVAAGLLGCPSNKPTEQEVTPSVRIDMQRYRVPLLPDDYAKGGETPLVTVVMFTDYACPPCGKTWEVIDNLLEDYGEDLRVVYRAYTVPGFGRGEQAAEAALSAGAQGKFWEMHKRLFEHPGAFDRPTLKAHAEALGLDVNRFLEDLDTGVHAAHRMRHRREATRMGIVGLPAMFINGVYLAGFSDEAAWHAVVDEEIKRAKELLANGTLRPELYAAIMEKASTQPVSPPKGAEELQKELAAKQAADAPVQLVAPKNDERYRIEPEDAPTVGPADAPVKVVAFVDVQCPFCRKAWTQEVAQLVESHKGEVAFAVRQLPLAIHPSAKGAAIASLAAHRQGKFWEFHDKLLRHEGDVGRDIFMTMATDLGLDTARFMADLDDPKLNEQVERDARLGLAVGVTGTPGYFVNGLYAGGYRPGELAELIKKELEHAQSLVAQGVEKGAVFDKLMAEAVQPADFPNQ